MSNNPTGAAPHQSESMVWIDGELVPKSRAMVSVYDHGLLYGDGVFEGIRAYGGRILKLATHLERMWQSAESIRMRPPYTKDEIARAIRATIEANRLPDGYIRLVFTRGAGNLGLDPRKCPRPCAIVIVDTIQLYPPEMYRKGMRIIVAKRPRIPVECLDPSIKSLNYLNNILAKLEAVDADVFEAIMLNTDGHVAECTGDNIFGVKGNTVYTPPVEAGLLNGVTRRYVMQELAPALGYEVRERMMRLDDLLAMDEIFLTGTAAEIIGVSAVGDRTIGAGETGPATTAIAAEFRRRMAAGAPED